MKKNLIVEKNIIFILQVEIKPYICIAFHKQIIAEITQLVE